MNLMLMVSMSINELMRQGHLSSSRSVIPMAVVDLGPIYRVGLPPEGPTRFFDTLFSRQPKSRSGWDCSIRAVDY